MIFEENLQYQRPALESQPLEWKILLSWIGSGKQVLEAGCHSGDFSKLLQQHNNQVTGIELNKLALDTARPFLTASIIGDVESEEVWKQLEGKKFDIILFEHVLEHLTDPWKVLKRCKNILSEHGQLIISIPNISNAVQRFNFLFGKFEYEETGVMDRTHLRFFNFHSAKMMIEQCGYKVEEYSSPWQTNPMRVFIDHLPLLTHLRFLFRKSAPKFPRFSPNITDVVMLFRCSQD